MTSPLDTLAQKIGVSRVALVTGLDRSGVAVACAVRPGGHILQVCNGKGLTADTARISALMEAAELFCSERVDLFSLHTTSLRSLRELGAEVWGMDEMGSAGTLVDAALWSEDLVCSWREGYELLSGSNVFLPAVALFCPPPGATPLGPAAVRWSTNGMGAHVDRDQAVTHALLEATERDSLANALPNGWTPKALKERHLSAKLVAREAPRVSSLLSHLSQNALRCFLFDLSTQLEVPVAGALVWDEQGAVPLTAGYAAGLDWEKALEGALLEAVQSRLTDVHGAREDVSAMAQSDVDTLARWLKALGEGQPRFRCKPVRRVLTEHLARHDVSRIAAVELGTPELGISVIKVVIPSFTVSELL